MGFQEKPKRPPSVWIAQILLSLIACVFLAFPLLLVVMNVPLSFLFFLSVFFIIFVVLPIFSVVGMAKRKNWGRWIGVGVLSILFILVVLGQLIQPEGPLDYYEYENTTQRISGIVTSVIIFGLFLLLILRLAFAKKVSQFFSSSTYADAIQTINPLP